MTIDTKRAYLAALTIWLDAADKWELHYKSCCSCDRHMGPNPRCGYGVRSHEHEQLTHRAAKAADLAAVEADAAEMAR